MDELDKMVNYMLWFSICVKLTGRSDDETRELIKKASAEIKEELDALKITK